MLAYRREIDGLRAIAVMPVLFFHAGFAGFYGGFVGVDIFFVLSGYLITSIILSDLQQQRFSIVTFYERRARRIMPALFTMLALSSVAAFCLLSAKELQHYAQSLLAVITFVSNIFFYLDSGYFAPAAEELPLLHTWSLAVEEQYYVFFPLLMAWLWQWRKTSLVPAIAIIALASFGWALWLVQQGQADANFYLIFSRSWELMVGSLLAFVALDNIRIARWLREAICIAAMLGLLLAFNMLNNTYSWPGVATLLPVVSTALLVLFCQPTTLVGKLLCQRYMVGIGLISYSLYLWHQPLFAFVRIKSLAEPSALVFTLLILTSMLLAYVSWRYIEAPFRNKARVSRRQIFQYSGAAITLCLLAGVFTLQQQGLPQRFNLPDYSASMQSSPMRQQCHTEGENYLKPSEACRYFQPQVSWAVLGDSHGVELAYALGKQLQAEQDGVLQLTFSACPPLSSLTVKEQGCSAWQQDALAHLRDNKSIENVVLIYRYSSFLFGNHNKSYPSLPNQSPAGLIQQASAYNADNLRELYWQDLKHKVDTLLLSGKRVFIVYPVPELPLSIVKLSSPLSIFSNQTLLDVNNTLPRSYYDQRNAYILDKLDSLPFSDKLVAVKPASVLCDEQHCAAVKHDKAMYFDDDHLSISGATAVAEMIVNRALLTAN